MFGKIKENLQNELQLIKEAGLYKSERIITSSQDAIIKISTGEEVINFCANNYLGLSNNPEVIEAAKETMRTTLTVREPGLSASAFCKSCSASSNRPILI